MRRYAGIGSRTTPKEVLLKMTELAARLETEGWTLRSGGAAGADFAFAAGVKDRANREIFRPDDATDAARAVAAKHHPVWDQISQYAQNLHGRNSQIILGRDLTEPVLFVVCWTPLPMIKGGTKMGCNIAEDHGIPVFNLYSASAEDELEKFLKTI